jgi:hypothetical protein
MLQFTRAIVKVNLCVYFYIEKCYNFTAINFAVWLAAVVYELSEYVFDVLVLTDVN